MDLSFRAALARLEAAGRVDTVSSRLPVDLAVSGVMKERDGDKAVMFTDVAGHNMPVIGNLLASERNCEAAFGADRATIRRMISGGFAHGIPPVVTDDGPVREVRSPGPIDLCAALPVLHHAPGDAGRFITGGVVIARHPTSGVYNASFHRMQLLGGHRTLIQMDLGRHLRGAWEAARQLGTDLPISVVIGTDVSLLYAAATMGSRMPEGKDELAAAGALQGEPLQVLRGITQDVLVPAQSEIALEATISTSETAKEGPFGEFVGYHSTTGPAPVVEVTALTHRADAIYHAINGSGRETVMLRKYVLEASLLDVLTASAPIVTDVNMTAGGLHRFHVNIAVRKTSAAHDGLQRNAALSAFGALKDIVRVVLADDDIDIHSESDVEYAIATRVEASSDVVIIPAARAHEYLRQSDRGVISKWLIDATVPFSQRDLFRRISFQEMTTD